MDFIKTILPWIGAAATGNVPALVSMAAAQVGNALGVDIAPTSDAIVKAVHGATPEQITAAKAADQDFALKMQALGFAQIKDLEAIAAADRSNARDREIKTGDSWTPRILAAIVVIGYLLVQWFVLSHVVPAEMRDIVLRSMGTLDMALGLVLGYYFGSSAGSHANQASIRSIAEDK